MRNLVVVALLLVAGAAAYFLLQEDPVPASDPIVESTPNEARIAAATATLDGDRIINADSEPGNWLAQGRTSDESRYSHLTAVNDTNAGQLGAALAIDTGSTRWF